MFGAKREAVKCVIAAVVAGDWGRERVPLRFSARYEGRRKLLMARWM